MGIIEDPQASSTTTAAPLALQSQSQSPSTYASTSRSTSRESTLVAREGPLHPLQSSPPGGTAAAAAAAATTPTRRRRRKSLRQEWKEGFWSERVEQGAYDGQFSRRGQYAQEDGRERMTEASHAWSLCEHPVNTSTSRTTTTPLETIPKRWSGWTASDHSAVSGLGAAEDSEEGKSFIQCESEDASLLCNSINDTKGHPTSARPSDDCGYCSASGLGREPAGLDALSLRASSSMGSRTEPQSQLSFNSLNHALSSASIDDDDDDTEGEDNDAALDAALVSSMQALAAAESLLDSTIKSRAQLASLRTSEDAVDSMLDRRELQLLRRLEQNRSLSQSLGRVNAELEGILASTACFGPNPRYAWRSPSWSGGVTSTTSMSQATMSNIDEGLEGIVGAKDEEATVGKSAARRLERMLSANRKPSQTNPQQRGDKNAEKVPTAKASPPQQAAGKRDAKSLLGALSAKSSNAVPRESSTSLINAGAPGPSSSTPPSVDQGSRPPLLSLVDRKTSTTSIASSLAFSSVPSSSAISQVQTSPAVTSPRRFATPTEAEVSRRIDSSSAATLDRGGDDTEIPGQSIPTSMSVSSLAALSAAEQRRRASRSSISSLPQTPSAEASSLSVNVSGEGKDTSPSPASASAAATESQAEVSPARGMGVGVLKFWSAR